MPARSKKSAEMILKGVVGASDGSLGMWQGCAIITRRRRESVLGSVISTLRGTLKTLNEFVREPVFGVVVMHGSAHVRVRIEIIQREDKNRLNLSKSR